MSRDRTNQRSIAEALNISQTTVAKVLNHDPTYRVAADTEEAIRKAARDMGYQHRRKRTGNIALIYCGEMYTGDYGLHIAMCEEAARTGHRLFLVNTPKFPSYRELSHSVNPLVADGAIIAGSYEPEVALQLSEVLPVVDLQGVIAKGKIDQISLDHTALGMEMTNHVLGFGHRNIAVIVHSVDDESWRLALNGYRQAMEEAGINVRPGLIMEKRNRIYHELLSEMFECSPKPTALLAWTTSDHPAILTALSAMGYRIPRDLSYVGWATSSFSSLNPYPEITCFDDIYPTISRATIRRLIDRTEDLDLAPNRLIVGAHIRKGETCVDIDGGHDAESLVTSSQQDSAVGVL